jgi:hypothetical protein
MGKRAEVGDKRRRKDGHYWEKLPGGKWKRLAKKGAEKKEPSVKEWASGGEPTPPASEAVGTLAASSTKSNSPEYGMLMTNRLDKRTEDLTPGERDALDAVTLFSRGNPDLVRDPGAYSEEGASRYGEAGAVAGPLMADGGHYKVKGTKEAYERAHERVAEMAEAPCDPGKPIYRGTALPQSVVDGLDVGEEMDLDPSHWSFDGEQADLNYAQQSAGDVPTLFKVAEPKQGTDISKVSFWADDEEFIAGGKVRVVEMGVTDAGSLELTVEQVPTPRRKLSEEEKKKRKREWAERQRKLGKL